MNASSQTGAVHGGRTDKQGCHNDRKHGTGYHCHEGGVSSDRSVSDKTKNESYLSEQDRTRPKTRDVVTQKKDNPFFETTFQQQPHSKGGSNYPDGYYAIAKSCEEAEYFLAVRGTEWEFPTGIYSVEKNSGGGMAKLTLTKNRQEMFWWPH